ncbi:MAG: phosphatidylglycerophosphatase A [Chloroflexota bacterium]|nr:phosphatidylglycerophosphatase A [Chloroflexota bacterium]
MLNSLGKFIGLGFGSGLSPLAPGTAGSLVAVFIYYLITLVAGGIAPYILVALILLGAPLGIWATGLLVTDADPDPGRAVWDEFVGMWITCLFLPATIPWLAAAFFTFRVFDVFKPWPARRLESWHGGLGIMADDVVAGIYGIALLAVFQLVWAWQSQG